MDQQQWMNILLFIGIILALYYFLFRNNNAEIYIEGMENRRPTQNGIASNADTYIESIKQMNTKLKDELNTSNADYRKKYENIVLEIDNLLNQLMLKGTLSIDKSKPEGSILRIAQLNEARAALNNVLKFIDKQP
jgi:hypothetical protein